MVARGSFGSPSWGVVRIGIAVAVFAPIVVMSAAVLQPPIYKASAEVRTSGAIENRAVAQQTIERLSGLYRVQPSPAEVLENLTVERREGKYFLTYEDTAPERAQAVVNSMGKVSGELVRPATLPEESASPRPWRNGLITLVVGLVLVGIAKLAIVRCT